MKGDLISVIIPIYNTENYFKRCIESIINQTYTNLEIILINDGSTDNSIQICREYEKKDKRIILIDKKNTGVSDSRNYGLNIATGKYISFIDSDDFLELNMYEQLIESIENNKAELAICKYNYYSKGNKTPYSKSYPNIIDKDIFFKDTIMSGENIALWNKLFIRDYIGSLRLNTNIDISEDILFLYEYVDKINKISYINKPLYNNNKDNISSITHINDPEKYITSIKAYYLIDKILEKNNIDERFYKQGYCLCNYVIYKQNIGKNFKYDEYDEIMNEYMKNHLLLKIKGIKYKTKVFFAYYFKNLYLFLKRIKRNNIGG